MDRVTTFSAYNSVIANLMASESRQNQAQIQVSSGKIGSDLKGFSDNAEALTATKTLMTRVDGYLQNAKSLQTRMDAQNLALNQVLDAGTQARQAIANAIATGKGDGLMIELNSYLGQAAAALNTQQNGRYVFAGGKVNTPPVAVQDITGLLSPPAGGVFQNDQLTPTAQLDETTTLKTGQLASDVGGDLFNAISSVATFDQGAGGPLNGQLTQTQITFLTNALHDFDAANATVTTAVANNGLAQNRVDQAVTTQQDRQTTLQTMVGNMTDVDMAEAASRLSQAQVALQASARIFASLQSTSLLNYLSGTTGG
jgi:flagellar hook-associated protein 3 FlgL